MDELGKTLGLGGDLDGWYTISSAQIVPLGAAKILAFYHRSLSKLLANVYPEHPWDLSRFAKKPQRYWSSKENQRRFMDELALKLGLGDLDGWYSVTVSRLAHLGAARILTLYGNSLSKLLAAVYPDHPWDISKFPTRPQNYWSSLENQKKSMDEVAHKLGVNDLEGWYSIGSKRLIAEGAESLLQCYGGSLSKLLAAVYPEHPWDLSKFSVKPQRYWSSIVNQRKFMDELGKKIGVNSEAELEKWYDRSPNLLLENGGGGLSKVYKHNLPKLLAAVYPHYNWQLWKFPRSRGRVLEDEAELDKLLTSLEEALGIRNPEEWYRVTTEQLKNLKVPFFYYKANGSSPNGLVALLSKRYPKIEWDAEVFFGRGYRRATQRWLTTMLADLFPSETILVDYIHPDLRFQVDIFLPEVNLAFEYQGAQHYEQLDVYGDLSDRVKRDEGKAAQCKASGLTLIAVPFWWNKERPALLSAILEHRPDLFTTKLSAFREEARRASPSNS